MATTNQYRPDYAVPPGWVLEERLEIQGISQAEFARLCGRSPKLISEIVSGKAPLEPETARQFEKVLGVDASIWLGLEDAYKPHRPQEAERPLDYMASREDLRPLITEPREDLAYEYKYWLDLTSKDHRDKAKLAKAAIALANHGGGFIVIGFEDQGQTLESQPRPEKIPEITQDSVNEAIRRYAAPEFPCEVYKVPHPDTGVSHTVVAVLGNTVPVMSKQGYRYKDKEVIAKNSYYIRKPGPRSEQPQTAEEWRTLLNRCVRANQDEMLEAIRSIVTGRVETQDSIPNALDDLRDYCTSARDRWKDLVLDEPDNSPVRFPHGYYEMAFSLVGATPANNLDELKNRLRDAGRIDWSGWPPFLYTLSQAPYPHEDFVESWLGQPDHNGRRHRESYQHDFWRASLDGKLYTIRGYREDDERDNNPPGRIFHTTLPIWRIGEGLLFASRFAETFAEVDKIAVYCRFTGLKGRHLAITRFNTPCSTNDSSSTDKVILKEQFTQQQVQDNLAEVLHSFLQPLYEKFNFFRLSSDYVSEELQHLRSRRF